MKVLFIFMFFMLMVFLFLFITYILSFLTNMGFSEKGSPFECGFFYYSLSGYSFSMPFFVISLVFLLFDVEIILLCLYPVSSLSYLNSMIVWFVLVMVFLATLYEWIKGILNWI